jgi:hypothetical protein
MEMITHSDTQCWASKLTMLFSFEWWVPCLWQQLFCWLPCLHNSKNVIHTLQQYVDTLLCFHFTKLSLHYNKTMDTFLYFHFTKLSLQWKWWDDNISHDHNNTSALFYYKRCTSHERWGGDTYPTTCYQRKLIIYIT